MSKRRRIGGGIVPIDRIGNTSLNSSDMESNSPPKKSIQKTVYSKRYKSVRRDQKVVNDINNSNIREFLPDLNSVPKSSVRNNKNTITNLNLGSMVTDKDIQHYDRRLISSPKSDNDSQIIEINGLPDDDNEAERRTHDRHHSRHSSPELRRPKSSGKGLLESSPANGSSYKYVVKMMGILRIIKEKGIRRSLNRVTLIYEFDKSDCTINFIYKGDYLFTKPISLRFDCKSLFFDDSYSCIGFSLRDLKQILGETEEGAFRIKTKTFVWENDNSSDLDGLIKMDTKRSSLNIRCKTEILKKKNDIIEKLTSIYQFNLNARNQSTANSAISDIFERRSRSKQNFLDKPYFTSLNHYPSSTKRKHTSVLQSSLATKIKVPNHNTEISENVVNPVARNLSAQSFYSNTPISKNILVTNNKLEMNVRRSNRLSSADKRPQTYNLDSFEEDDTDPYEKPEPFKPTLHQKFPDDTSYTVTNQDFKCLYNKDWINDSIIDFFVKYYVEVSIDKSIIKRDDVYIMSSFFYSKLTSDPQSLYENVRKWVQNADLLKRKYVVIPMNVNFHWYGCIITNLDVYLKFALLQQKAENQLKDITKKEETEKVNAENSKSRESSADNSKDGGNMTATTSTNDENTATTTAANDNSETNKEKVEKAEIKDAPREPPKDNYHDDVSLGFPTIEILTFDSLRGTHTREVDPIKEFIIGYAKDKYDLIIDKSYIKMKTCLVPQQPNMSDCGVHVILTIKKFFEDPIATIEIWRNSKTRGRASNKIINQYFEKAERNKKRKALREVLKALLAAQIKRTGYTSDEEAGKYEEEDDEDIEIIEEMPKQPDPEEADNKEEDDKKKSQIKEEATNKDKDENDKLDDNQPKDENITEDQNNVEPSSQRGLSDSPRDADAYSNIFTQKDNSPSDALNLSPSKITNGLSSDPPSSPEHAFDDFPQNPVTLDTNKASLSSSPILSPRESDDDLVIPSEAIPSANFLESSPTKYRNAYKTRKGAESITSRFFDKPRLAIREKVDNHDIVPILGEPIRKNEEINQLVISSPGYMDGSQQNDVSHSVVISDGDGDVNLVEKVLEPSPFISGDELEKRDPAEIISEKVQKELNNNDLHEIYPAESEEANVSEQNLKRNVSSNHFPVLIHDDRASNSQSQPISLDDD